MQQAIERHECGAADVIPIILRPVSWQKTPFGKFQALPKNANPITSGKWHHQDEAFYEVAEGIRGIAEARLAKEEGFRKGKDQRYETSQKRDDASTILETDIENWLKQQLDPGKLISNVSSINPPNSHFPYIELGKLLLPVFEQVIQSNLDSPEDYYNKGVELYDVKNYEESIQAFEQAIRVDPDFADAHNGKGSVLYSLKRYEEALLAYEQATRLNSHSTIIYNNKGDVLYNLKRYEEALLDYEYALRLDPNFAISYYGRGHAFWGLRRYEEALQDYEQALHLDPNSAITYYNKSLVLDKLGRREEAQQAKERARELGYLG